MQAMFVQQAVVVAAMTDRELLLTPVMNHSEFGQQYPGNVDDNEHDWRALLDLKAMALEVLVRQRAPRQPPLDPRVWTALPSEFRSFRTDMFRQPCMPLPDNRTVYTFGRWKPSLDNVRQRW